MTNVAVMVLSAVVIPAVIVREVLVGVGAVTVAWAIPLSIVTGGGVLGVMLSA